MALSFIPGNILPSPGICISCGSAGLDCVDTGKNENYYGALLICVACFRDGALNIPELELTDRTLFHDTVADLEEKLEWRNNLEPTVAKLELDISQSLDRARRGFGQRRLADDPFSEIQPGTESSEQIQRDDNAVDGQLLFSVEELGLIGYHQ